MAKTPFTWVDIETIITDDAPANVVKAQAAVEKANATLKEAKVKLLALLNEQIDLEGGNIFRAVGAKPYTGEMTLGIGPAPKPKAAKAPEPVGFHWKNPNAS